jgi:hypothetical protein
MSDTLRLVFEGSFVESIIKPFVASNCGRLLPFFINPKALVALTVNNALSFGAIAPGSDVSSVKFAE